MSIKKKITILFLLSVTLMLSLSLWLSLTTTKKNRALIISNYLHSSKELLPLIFDNNQKTLKRKLQELNYQSLLTTPTGETLFNKNLGVGELKIIKNRDGLFLKINYLDDEYIFFDKTQDIFKQEALITHLFFIFDIALLIVIYFLVLKLVAPIKRLSSSMQQFAKGDFDISLDTKGSDEISRLAKSFNMMAKELKESFQDRENLLRYFGHEIRTPLAKAQYALENRDYASIQKNLAAIEKFVQEVLAMHLINAKNFHKEKFQASTLVVEALNKSNIEQEEDIVVQLKEDFLIYGDVHYLSIALKNLISNALNYTTTLPITITIEKNRIDVINKGEKLQEGLEYFLQPFHKKSTNGFGLGLSLCDLILKEHHFILEYNYKEKNNIFTIWFINSSS